jgi:ribonuclease P protein component
VVFFVINQVSGNMDSLKCNVDFRRAYHRGKCVVCPLFAMYINKTRGSTVRLGVTVSKKYGNAVKRNRARRIIKEAVRSVRPIMPQRGYDIVIVARTRLKSARMQDVSRALESVFAK